MPERGAALRLSKRLLEPPAPLASALRAGLRLEIGKAAWACTRPASPMRNGMMALARELSTVYVMGCDVCVEGTASGQNRASDSSAQSEHSRYAHERTRRRHLGIASRSSMYVGRGCRRGLEPRFTPMQEGGLVGADDGCGQQVMLGAGDGARQCRSLRRRDGVRRTGLAETGPPRRPSSLTRSMRGAESPRWLVVGKALGREDIGFDVACAWNDGRGSCNVLLGPGGGALRDRAAASLASAQRFRAVISWGRRAPHAEQGAASIDSPHSIETTPTFLRGMKGALGLEQESAVHHLLRRGKPQLAASKRNLHTIQWRGERTVTMKNELSGAISLRAGTMCRLWQRIPLVQVDAASRSSCRADPWQIYVRTLVNGPETDRPDCRLSRELDEMRAQMICGWHGTRKVTRLSMRDVVSGRTDS
ncbi:hypothetical protein Purlil1_9688 [Purpureocillium lilacinum]|uniref:Uncharacterized protein n=1 Tax=Purpureocillium lilacinum TaxID=33203 RepID=A0ABR0BPZ5_PURLI|nr:hypothetical protein Purlil1_9688 [Purpureocillium lilacinum]